MRRLLLVLAAVLVRLMGTALAAAARSIELSSSV